MTTRRRRKFAALSSILLLAACASPASTQNGDGSNAGPRFVRGGPDAEEYGASLGYPKGERATFLRVPSLVGSHSHLDELFEGRVIGKAATPSRLLRAASEPAIPWEFRDEALTLDAYLARNPTTGLLIARGDTILVERYQYDRHDRHRFTSWSMAKTVTSMLIGIALSEGRIKSVDDPAAAYVPELAGTEYGRTSLRHLLQMSSGVRFVEEYSGDDDVMKLARATFAKRGDGGVAAVLPFNERIAPGGTRFYYASVETEVLGLVLRSAVGRPITAYLEEKIWQPMGAEADATWLVDRSGQEATFCCINAVLRDYARLGLLLRTKATGAADNSSPQGGSWMPPPCEPTNRISVRESPPASSAMAIRRGSSRASDACSRCLGSAVSRSSSTRRVASLWCTRRFASRRPLARVPVNRRLCGPPPCTSSEGQRRGADELNNSLTVTDKKLTPRDAPMSCKHLRIITFFDPWGWHQVCDRSPPRQLESLRRPRSSERWP